MLYSVKNLSTGEVAVLTINSRDAWSEAVSIMKTDNIELLEIIKEDV